MKVIVDRVSKRLGTQIVLREVSLEVEEGELFFLLGPSGCGKTTLLRLVAGFYAPDAGTIRFGDRVVNELPPHQRNTALVFQNYALWPHLSVAANVAYGLEVRGVVATERDRRVGEALEMVRMTAFERRMPNQLSGGQQQRVALARALVVQPDVLLLDEPLSNLDAQLRLEMREEIRRIHALSRITTLYVTHDQKEALSLASRLAVLHEGRVEQVGSPRAVYRHPATAFVAGFVGEANWLDAQVLEAGPHRVRVAPVGVPEVWEIPATATALSAGAPVRLGFRPEAVRSGDGPGNRLQGRLLAVSYLGDRQELSLELPGAAALKLLERDDQRTWQPGEMWTGRIAVEDILVFPRG